MTTYDFKGLNDRLLTNPVFVIEHKIGLEGKVKGSEFEAYNPLRDDKKLGSFKINLLTGVWKDFSIDKGGTDLISLYAYIKNTTNGRAYAALSDGEVPVVYSKNRQKKNKAIEMTICKVIPDDFEFYDRKYFDGKPELPTDVYKYRDTEGNLQFLIYKFIIDKKKYFSHLTLWQDSYHKKLRWVGYGKNLSLYRLDSVMRYNDKPVLIVEGEKCVDAVREYLKNNFKDYPIVPTCWCGGHGGWKNANLTVLKDRQIIYMPDNDHEDNKFESQRSMQKACDKTGGVVLKMNDEVVRSLYIEQGVSLNEDDLKGWDIADGIEDGLNLISFLDGLPHRSKRVEIEDNSYKKDYICEYVAAPKGIFYLNGKGKIVGNLENLEILMNYYGYEIKYNIINGIEDCWIQGKKFNDEDYLNEFYTKIVSLANTNEFPTVFIDRFVSSLAIKNKYNPVKEWIHSKKWDGVDRITELINAIECPADFNLELKTALIKRWLISLYGFAVRKPFDNFRSRGVLVLQGRQLIGKTAFFKGLVGKHTEWFGEGESLNAENKDSKMTCLSYWIVELGELEATTKYSMPHLKAFITNSKDKIRTPFSRKPTYFWRRTGVCATVNQEQYLTDTENSRFWNIPALKINYKIYETLDVQQLHAQSGYLYDNGEQWWLTEYEERLLSPSNKKHVYQDKVDELIRSKYAWRQIDNGWEYIVVKWQSCAEILMELGINNPTKSDLIRAGFVLKDILKIKTIPPEWRKRGYTVYPTPPLKSVLDV